MGELAGDECINRTRTARCILPGKCRRDSLRAFHPNLVPFEIQGGQRGAEKQSLNEQRKENRQFSACGHRMKERIAAFESARRAASYLGSAAAIALAPSTPISL